MEDKTEERVRGMEGGGWARINSSGMRDREGEECKSEVL